MTTPNVDDNLRPHQWASYASARVEADVRLIGSDTLQDVGIGCKSPDGSELYSFVVNTTGEWQILEEHVPASGSDALVASGRSAAIKPLAVGDHLTALCEVTIPGGSTMGFAVNGTTVASVPVNAAVQSWGPAIALCTCDGDSAEGEFLNMAVYDETGQRRCTTRQASIGSADSDATGMNNVGYRGHGLGRRCSAAVAPPSPRSRRWSSQGTFCCLAIAGRLAQRFWGHAVSE